MRTLFPLLPLRNVFLARSTKVATSVGSGATESVPVSMGPASSRSLMSPRPLDLFQRRRVLHGDDHRLDGVVRGMDRGRVDERGDTSPVGDRELDLLGAHGVGAARLPERRELAQRDLPPVRESARHHPQQLLGRLARGAQGLDDALRLPVERERRAGRGVEDYDADR